MKLNYEQCVAWLGSEAGISADVAEIDGEAYVFSEDSWDEEEECYTEVWQIDEYDDEIMTDLRIGYNNVIDIFGEEGQVKREYFIK